MLIMKEKVPQVDLTDISIQNFPEVNFPKNFPFELLVNIGIHPLIYLKYFLMYKMEGLRKSEQTGPETLKTRAFILQQMRIVDNQLLKNEIKYYFTFDFTWFLAVRKLMKIYLDERNKDVSDTSKNNAQQINSSIREVVSEDPLLSDQTSDSFEPLHFSFGPPEFDSQDSNSDIITNTKNTDPLKDLNTGYSLHPEFFDLTLAVADLLGITPSEPQVAQKNVISIFQDNLDLSDPCRGEDAVIEKITELKTALKILSVSKAADLDSKGNCLKITRLFGSYQEVNLKNIKLKNASIEIIKFILNLLGPDASFEDDAYIVASISNLLIHFSENGVDIDLFPQIQKCLDDLKLNIRLA
ncbi:hypothetical protein GF354_05795 [Candidatus Peregrinibacteria bacterium]|nr:hypothetical protein [Candidatus Peregrinibacteria bacterium]